MIEMLYYFKVLQRCVDKNLVICRAVCIHTNSTPRKLKKYKTPSIQKKIIQYKLHFNDASNINFLKNILFVSCPEKDS